MPALSMLAGIGRREEGRKYHISVDVVAIPSYAKLLHTMNSEDYAVLNPENALDPSLQHILDQQRSDTIPDTSTYVDIR